MNREINVLTENLPFSQEEIDILLDQWALIRNQIDARTYAGSANYAESDIYPIDRYAGSANHVGSSLSSLTHTHPHSMDTLADMVVCLRANPEWARALLPIIADIIANQP